MLRRRRVISVTSLPAFLADRTICFSHRFFQAVTAAGDVITV